MTPGAQRYHRNMLLFGREGQRKLCDTSVVVMGTGGLGSPIIQHLALLGVKSITAIDDEELDETNRNRFIGAKAIDPVPGSKKVDLVCRMVQEINPDVKCEALHTNLVSQEAFAAIPEADWAFGCFDDDGPRHILNELCAAYDKPYIDLASDVLEKGVYGGRVFVCHHGDGCLFCMNVLDRRSVRRYISSPAERAQEDDIYGIEKEALGLKGPSVSPINGVVAALAATEFMVAVTGMRPPTRHQEYRGGDSKVMVRQDRPPSQCYYCHGIRGKHADADVERYLRIPHLSGTS